MKSNYVLLLIAAVSTTSACSVSTDYQHAESSRKIIYKYFKTTQEPSGKPLTEDSYIYSEGIAMLGLLCTAPEGYTYGSVLIDEFGFYVSPTAGESIYVASWTSKYSDTCIQLDENGSDISINYAGPGYTSDPYYLAVEFTSARFSFYESATKADDSVFSSFNTSSGAYTEIIQFYNIMTNTSYTVVIN